jgi:dihydrofolate reductase
MTRTTYYTASSLDGFVADAHNSLDWLLRQDIDDDGPLNYGDFVSGIGAVVMGSTTYQWILAHQADSWPYEVPAWVMTSRDLPRVDGDIRVARGDVRPVHAEMMAAADGRDLWVVGGGDLAGQFADAGLLDELVVALAPVTLGAGAPLLPRPLDLRLEEVARNRAFACARYSVNGPIEPADDTAPSVGQRR